MTSEGLASERVAYLPGTPDQPAPSPLRLVHHRGATGRRWWVDPPGTGTRPCDCGALPELGTHHVRTGIEPRKTMRG